MKSATDDYPENRFSNLNCGSLVYYLLVAEIKALLSHEIITKHIDKRSERDVNYMTKDVNYMTSSTNVQMSENEYLSLCSW